ncbi:MAG: hypothetical protein KF752_08475 [Pirellulaceae bacterium]|nr:hypothetical protein [Pirellulaceae bacterium]
MEPLKVAILLYFLAVALAAVDIFIPTAGTLLIASALSAIASIYFGFLTGVYSGMAMSILVLGTIPVFTYVAIKFWPHTPIGRRILLTPPKIQADSHSEALRRWIGTVVVNRWPLLPSGQIQIGKQRFNATSIDSRPIEVGQRVKVVDARELLLIVASTNEQETEIPEADRIPSSSLASQGSMPSEQALLEAPAEQLGLNSLDELPLDETEFPAR